MDPAVDAALARAFPGRAVASVSEPSGSEQPSNRVVTVDFRDGERAFLKVATDGDGGHDRVAREAGVARYVLANCDLRAPRVLAADAEGDPPFVAAAPLSGVPLDRRWDGAATDERASLLRSVGDGLARLHAARFDRSGRIRDGDADGLETDADAWSAVLRNEVDRRTAERFPGRFAGARDRVREAIRTRRDRLDATPAALLHCDPRPANYFLLPGGPPGFVDWEAALVGDPALDLRFAENQYVERVDVAETNRDRLLRALRAGYRERASRLPEGFGATRPLYRAVTFLLLQVASFDAWAPRAADPTDALAAWVREEFDRRVDAVE